MLGALCRDLLSRIDIDASALVWLRREEAESERRFLILSAVSPAGLGDCGTRGERQLTLGDRPNVGDGENSLE